MAHYGFQGTASEYAAIHHWVRYRLGTPKTCVDCGKTGGTTRKYHWANISKQYLRDLSDWERLCCLCHHRKDRDRNYWTDKYCKNGHKLVLTNLYLRKDSHPPYHRKFIECRQCREAQRIKYRMKIGETWEPDAKRYIELSTPKAQS